MKIFLLFFLLFNILYAKGFEQKFNIVTVSPKVQSKQNKKEFFGNITYDERKIYDVTTRFDGFVEKLYVDDSFEHINKNQPLFKVYSKEIYNLKRELSSLSNLGKNIQDTINKKLSLYDIDPKSLKNPESFEFYSKYSGLVIEKNINNGSFIKSGQVLYKIADTSTMWLVAKVYQKDIGFISSGMDAYVYIDGLNDSFKGKISKIYTKINPKDLTCDVRVEISNKEGRLFENMFARVVFGDHKKDMLTLPKEAVITKQNKNYVFIKSGDFYEPKEISAVNMGTYFQIFSGLGEQDKVVKNALFLLDSDAVTNGLFSSDDEW